ncbi:GntR family transcriptional regulator (plasmid) [Microtetraspora malaysiensis]|uniref:winged helix-turn-helix domain-containing protein n=1 Tax=Microtetraspora malaysiensis TaxID=161358 RepID=UPI003D90E659
MPRTRPRTPVPIYALIVDAIKGDIDSGNLRPGQKLPTEQELCDRHQASRDTVRRALEILREDGTIYTRRPEGSFVGPEDAPQIREARPAEQFAASLAEEIRRGVYQPDEALPSENELVERLGTSKKSIRGAMELLRERGWAYTVPKIGTFVAARDKWPAA